MINVNTVYQTVLFILNKEQRGYMTPAEFNSLATQVQLEIFDKYFEDLNVFLRQQTNDSEYANRVKTVEEKISIFEEQQTLETPYDLNTLTPGFYKLGSVTYVRSSLNPFGPNYATTLEEVTQHEFNLINKSPLTRPSDTFPIFTLRNNQLKISPSITELTINYVRKPKNVRWGYTTGSLGQYLYDETVYNPPTYPSATDPTTAGSTQFELSDIDQTDIILKILQYAGVIIRDPQIVQTATTLQQQDEVAEKT
jgi:hypothetical protein